MHTSPPASYLGTQLDRRYRLDRLIGEGATAWVFAAEDKRLERHVAVKLLKPWLAEEQISRRKRFLHEGRILARLVHPHIVGVHDAGETEAGLGYLVMELSDAGSLEDELFRLGVLSVEECVRVLLPLVGALACAHDRGIVHRDIKPANIVLAHERSQATAKLLDFGIAKRSDAGGSSDHALGTPSYMAPEQARGEALSPATDVWSLGVVFFRCLSGRMPFDAKSSLDTLLKLVHERAPRFAGACPTLGPHLAIALDRALEPEPSRRYPDMRSFARALASACAQDGLRVARSPEPVGLPNFEQWLERADIEFTKPLDSSERKQIALRSTHRSTRWRVALTLAVIAAAVLGTAFGWPSAAPVATRDSPSATGMAPSEPPRAEATPPPAAIMSVSEESIATAAPESAATRENVAATDAQPALPSAARRRSARFKLGSSAPPSLARSRPPAAGQDENVQSPAPAKPKSELLTSWEW